MSRNRSRLVSCVVLAVSLSASAAELPEVKWFRFCLDSVDQNLPPKDAKTLQFWKAQCDDKHKAISDAGKATPEYTKQKERYDKQLAVIDPFIGNADVATVTGDSIRDGASAAQFGEGELFALETGANAEEKIKRLNKATSLFKDCLAKLEARKTADPQWAARPSSSGPDTGGSLEKRCKDGLAKADKGLSGLKPQWEAAGRKRAKELHDISYVKLVKNENYPDGLESSTDPLDAIDSFQRYYFLATEGEWLHKSTEALIAQYPFTAEEKIVGSVTANAMLEKARVIWDKGHKGAEKWKAKSDAGQGQYDKELKKSLSGDRLSLVQKQGRPNWTSNMTERSDTIRTGLKSYSTAEWFRYDGNGCNTFYYFSGAKLTKTKKEGFGCR